GQTIEEALDNGRAWVAKGFRYSYDMLGEAAITAQQSVQYFAEYEQAIRRIGETGAGRGVHEGPGISVKLSARHPRFTRSQIKRAQLDGLEGYPVFTRKLHTDVCYIACARKLLDATDLVYPQFATHNALTLATVHAMAGPTFHAGKYEFQCLHGMGERLYED